MGNARHSHPSADEYLHPPVGGYLKLGNAVVAQHKVSYLGLAGKPKFGKKMEHRSRGRYSAKIDASVRGEEIPTMECGHQFEAEPETHIA